MAVQNIGMAPAAVNIDPIYAGDDYVAVLTITTKVAGVPTPVDLTGGTATAQFRTAPGAGSPVAFTVTITTPAAGVVTLELAAAATVALPAEGGVWDLQITIGGKTRTYMRGTVKVQNQVTAA